jgi:hypothetical protein
MSADLTIPLFYTIIVLAATAYTLYSKWLDYRYEKTESEEPDILRNL